MSDEQNTDQAGSEGREASELADLLPCPCCGAPGEIERDSSIFAGQVYSDRYPEPVCRQAHGHRVRCMSCGLQTCWWHYQQESVDAWNDRAR